MGGATNADRDQYGLEKQRGERKIENYLRQRDDHGLMP